MELLHKDEKLNKWDERFCLLAKYVSDWSKDTTQVGAVLYSKKGGDVVVLPFLTAV